MKKRDLAARGFESQKRAEALEERSKKSQNQKNELHPYRVANPKMHLDRQLERSGKPNFITDAPTVYQLGEASKIQ